MVQGPEELTRPNLIIMKKPSVQKFDGHIKGKVMSGDMMMKPKDMMKSKGKKKMSKDMMRPKVPKMC